LTDFKNGRIRVLVATDIAARGIDVSGITHVINFDIPETATTYIHRIGRTGRAEATGDALSLVSREDLGTLRDIERILGKPIERREMPDFDYSQAAPPRSANEGGEDQRERGRRPQPRAASRSGQHRGGVSRHR
jgi:ATP-dependent RNA helicase RhlE